ncbi:hypothetical protein F5X97DRAFT_140239 [Nemania serpens]|nr:hypothetical protein F5X97DRAFT_140239 [Nemania serpens]
MDAFKKVLGGDKQSTGGAQPNAAGAGAGAGVAGQKDDYGDKGAAFANKKYFGNKLSHEQLEKATDSARAGFEKATGNKVPEKFSN